MKTFVWYDLETTGVERGRDRIVQLAAQRTDEALNAVGPPTMLHCHPAPDVLPSIGATLVHRITPQFALKNGVSEAVLAERVRALLEQPQTCAIGYNAMSFDHEFIRTLLYRNLRDPYRWHWAEGNTRWDLIDVARAAYALRPTGLQWPRNEQGKPSFVLEALAQANGIPLTAAHDALADVQALIAFARCLRGAQPKLWEHALGMRRRRTVDELLSAAQRVPMLLVTGRIDAKLGCTAPFICLGREPGVGHGWVLWNLRRDPEPFLRRSPAELRALLFTPGDQLADPEDRPGLLRINSGKSPFVAPSTFLREDAVCERLAIDRTTIRARIVTLRGNPEFAARCKEVFDRAKHPMPTALTHDASGQAVARDVDDALYDGMLPDQDRVALDRLLAQGPAGLAGPPPVFRDARVPELLFRYRARNFPAALNAADRSRWAAHVRARLNAPADNGNTVYSAWQAELDKRMAAATDRDKQLFTALAEHGRALWNVGQESPE